MENVDFTGKYSLIGSQFSFNGQKVVIRKRVKDLDKKPLQFMLLFNGKGRPTYISSLYPVLGVSGAFKFDYQGILYQLEIKKGVVTISKDPISGDSHNIRADKETGHTVLI